ncbi:hypothetical protein, variant 1 [Aphanomyces invadans]|nr:hypothetical protein, variant 1 [Aphanomyces invadans]ETW03454.1 hypothetical protein, variant 1 [Aphanomyces invadans]|eukprot:XP_008867683.1 hypothetical protein, variant 1 [Aphanomyces invadans]
MKQMGVPLHTYLYQVILNICGQSTAANNLVADAFEVYEHMKIHAAAAMPKSKKHPVDESSYSALIKLCSKQHMTERALALITELEDNKVAPKLRTFAPLLVEFTSILDLKQAWWVYEKLVHHGIDATEAEYAALLGASSALNDLDMFYKVLGIFCDEILVPSPSTWQILKEFFGKPGIHKDKWLCNVGEVNKAGICSVTGSTLQSVELSAEKQQALLTKVENLVCTSDERVAQWAAFKAWLDEHGPFDVIIDAANVGYFNQNFEGGGFNYGQIQTVVQAYQSKGLTPLIVLHKRRTKDNQVPAQHRAMVQQWKDEKTMFNCEYGNNDDWYWLYAAVKLGGRTLVVSNDEMRDHHFQMIHNQDFHRWKERHLVHYEVRGHNVVLHEPSVYSKRSQHLASSWHFPTTSSSDWLVFHRRRQPAP